MKKGTDFILSSIILFGYDINRLQSFYTEHFKFKVVSAIQDVWVVLRADNTEIAFHKIGSDYAPKEGEDFKVESNVKLVFQTQEDLYLIRERMVNSGIKMKKIKSFEGMNSLFCDGEDPEGNVFQIEQVLTTI